MKFISLVCFILMIVNLSFSAAEGKIRVADDLSLQYHKVGDGPEIVIIPLAAWLSGDLGSLAEGRTLVFYDPRNRGNSDRVDDSRIGLDQDVEDLEAVRKFVGAEKIKIIGWSYFGTVAARYAMTFPDRVEAIVQIGPYAPNRFMYQNEVLEKMDSRMDPVHKKKLDVLLQQGKSTTREYCEQWLKTVIATQFANQANVEKMKSDPCSTPLERPDTIQHLFTLYEKSMEKWDWDTKVEKMNVRRLVIQGLRDPTPEESAWEWVTSREARILLIEGAGHLPWLEKPDIFFAAVDAFFKGEWPKDSEEPDLTNVETKEE